MANYQVHLTLKSANEKTGPIPVSTTTATTCPDACPFKKNGCYADGGPLAIHWRAVTEEKRGTAWGEFCESIAALPDGQLWRHNQAGDLPGDGDAIDAAALGELVKANIGKRGFTYTHKPATPENVQWVRAANEWGFTVNLSANSLEHADVISATGLPIVTVLPVDAPAKLETPAGRTVVTCPATYRDGVSCATCQLCARRDRKVIIGFPAHGAGKARVQRVFMMSRAA